MTKRMLFVLAALALAGAGFYYRTQNAKGAHNRASQIVASDTAGADTVTAQTDLASYVKQHLGASVSYTLTGSYNRALAAAQASAAAASQANGQIYAAAQAACAGKSDSITQANCNQAYLSTHLVNVPTTTPAPAPDLADYKHSLTSPPFAPDLAGALFVGAAAALIMALLPQSRRRR
jgi:hypothetical protein